MTAACPRHTTPIQLDAPALATLEAVRRYTGLICTIIDRDDFERDGDRVALQFAVQTLAEHVGDMEYDFSLPPVTEAQRDAEQQAHEATLEAVCFAVEACRPEPAA